MLLETPWFNVFAPVEPRGLMFPRDYSEQVLSRHYPRIPWH